MALDANERRGRRQSIAFADRRNRRPTIEIALINNMPDAALRSTEQQFCVAIQEAGAGLPVNLRLYTLPSVVRAGEAADHVAANYDDIGGLLRTTCDAVVVTGAEPKAANLRDEPYWAEMTELVDWAAASTRSTMWSCLAAHAAVQYLHGIERRPLGEKLSGIFDCAAVRLDPLVVGTTATVAVPHSRWNALHRDELKACGYEMLRVSDEAGVDLFALDRGSRFVFMQGHPEYATDSLLREYRRDVGRFLRGERPEYPREPAHYFSAEAVVLLHAYRRRCEANRDPALLAVFPNVASPFAIDNRWKRPTAVLYRNWLRTLASEATNTAAVA